MWLSAMGAAIHTHGSPRDRSTDSRHAGDESTDDRHAECTHMIHRQHTTGTHRTEERYG